VNELLKLKEDLTKERDEQLQEISRLREELAESNTKQSELEQRKADADEKIQEVCITVKKSDVLSFSNDLF
jgi:DNA repair exonuclease SbcCD ATPase subunit